MGKAGVKCGKNGCVVGSGFETAKRKKSKGSWITIINDRVSCLSEKTQEYNNKNEDTHEHSIPRPSQSLPPALVRRRSVPRWTPASVFGGRRKTGGVVGWVVSMQNQHT